MPVSKNENVNVCTFVFFSVKREAPKALPNLNQKREICVDSKMASVFVEDSKWSDECDDVTWVFGDGRQSPEVSDAFKTE